MGRDYNLDLCLLSPAARAGAAAASTDASTSSTHELTRSRSDRSLESPQAQQITIFYNGRVCVCDVTEIQAKAILCMAKRETDERLGTSASGKHHPPLDPASPPSCQLDSRSAPHAAAAGGLSMKKSLQRFLQERKSRIQATCPYSHSSS